MEEAVWLFFGVVSVIIAIGIIINISANNDEAKLSVMKDTMKKLEVQCNFVCETTEGNMLSINVDLPSRSIIYTRKDRICSNYLEDIECVRCQCDLDPFELNLINSSISQRFDKHTYKCFFERLSQSVSMNCMG